MTKHWETSDDGSRDLVDNSLHSMNTRKGGAGVVRSKST